MHRRSFLASALAASVATLVPAVIEAKPGTQLSFWDFEETRVMVGLLPWHEHRKQLIASMQHLRARGRISEGLLHDIALRGRRTGRTSKELVRSLTYARFGVPRMYVVTHMEGKVSTWVTAMTMARRIPGLEVVTNRRPDGQAIERYIAHNGRKVFQIATESQVRLGFVSTAGFKVIEDHQVIERRAHQGPIFPV